MRRFNVSMIVLVLATTVLFSCGGGGGDKSDVTGGGGGGSTILAGTFTPTTPSPGANTVSMSGSGTSNIMTLAVNVSGTNDVFGASFDVVYDPTMIEFVNWTTGRLLEAGGHQVTYQVNAQQAGRVVVGVSRTTLGTGASAGVATPLINLQFRLNEPGTSQVAFERAALLNTMDPPQSIGGIAFSGGTLAAN
jgi:hypothetical protein